MSEKDILYSHFPKAIRIPWAQVEDLLWKTFVSIRAEGFEPDLIVAVARGGLVPARILADYMKMKYICTLQMGHWEGEGELSETPNLVYPLPDIDLRGKRVLVVDDVSDEGQTMQKVADYLKPRTLQLKSAVLVSKSDSRFMADFCPRLIDEWRWVFLPWSKHEDLVSFTEKVLQLTGGATIEDIIRILEEAMSVEVATPEIEKVLFDMQRAGEIAEDSGKVWTLI